MLGLGSRVLKEGDLCCIIFGAPVPLILRLVGEHYRLVAEAVVDWMLGDKYEEQVFELV